MRRGPLKEMGLEGVAGEDSVGKLLGYLVPTLP
jgi:hypothetical protein